MWMPCAIALSFVLGMMLQSARGSVNDKEGRRVTGVGGFFFKSQNPGKLAAWYREHLGVALQPGGEGANALQFHSFEWREKDHAERAGATVFSIFPADTKYFGAGSSQFMVNFRVANLELLLSQLRQEGVRVDDKIEDQSYGRFGWAMDSDGHRIELWEPKDK
jgi:predicted enzyme related to lactoylglutathione lyase